MPFRDKSNRKFFSSFDFHIALTLTYRVDGSTAFNLHFTTRVDNSNRFGLPSTNTYYCHMEDDGIHQNPIFRVSTGDRLTITLFNDLEVAPDDLKNRSTGHCGAFINTTTSTNVHFHGTHVNPKCHYDEVVRTLVNAGQNFTFNFTIPTFQPHGLLWWHPHTYPNSLNQITGGATGVFVVDGIDAVQPGVRGLPERILVFRSEPSSQTSNVYPTPFEDISLNFIPIYFSNNDYIPPTYSIKPNER